jgi:predicted nucleic acid-binding protein
MFDIRLVDAVTIAAHRGIYAYDAYFIVCAQQLPAALITLDGGLATAARAVGVEVIEVTA